MRIDVSAPADASTRPITVPKTLFMTLESTQTVDPPTTDIDPAGGVLVVTGVMNVPVGSGVQAEVLDQRRVRVTLTAPLDAPISFNYRISNGLAEAEGTITVVEIPHPQRLQPPIATDDQATVRVGDAIDIPVLDNDEQPDGEEITLAARARAGSPGRRRSAVRLRRPAALPRPGDGRQLLRGVLDRGHRRADRPGAGAISVRERNAATNNPPVPRTITARALAGQTVRIEIPTSGVDPDGDSVQLVGQATNPEKGSVVAIDGNSLEYRAGDYSSGTDVFQYVVVDRLGARATGTIRVGISAPLEGARNPVANFDTVLVRPGRTVSVRALLNDSDPDGSALHIRQVVPNGDGIVAEIVGEDVVDITPPDAPGDYSVIYTIENETGGTSSNFIRVTVSTGRAARASDGRRHRAQRHRRARPHTVDVRVLDRAFFADGDVAVLGVELVPGFGESAEVLPNKRVRVTIGDRSQIIPFAVVHPDEPGIRAYAFIRVPGFEDALPQINTKAPLLVVKSEATLRIELSEYVVALGGSQVRLTDSSTVRATHANGASLVVDEDTLQFTSADRYWGPASISFEVTDGTSATDPDGHVTTLSLPIDGRAAREPAARVQRRRRRLRTRSGEGARPRQAHQVPLRRRHRRAHLHDPRPAARRIPCRAQRAASAGDRRRRGDQREHDERHARGPRRPQGRSERPDPAARRPVDAPARAAHRRPEHHAARGDHRDRRARERRLDQPVPRGSAAGHRHPRPRRHLAAAGAHDLPERRPVAAHGDASPTPRSRSTRPCSTRSPTRPATSTGWCGAP